MALRVQTQPVLTSGRFGNVRLGQELGSGGEGAVHEIEGHADFAAKIYHQGLSRQRRNKLLAMQGLATAELQRIAAWPIEIIAAGGRPCGFIMPKVRNAKEIHFVYGPKSRKQHFPDAGFAFLVHCAANLARAFAEVHAAGVVIGDVNDRLVLVAPDATVTLIDCDSFQIEVQGRLHLCPVGVGSFTPPELQASAFASVKRTPNHDAFGLAILIFHLLFMGRHPFAGRSQSGGDATIEEAIQSFRFAYSQDVARTRMLAPPGTLDPARTTPGIAALFEQAFGPQGVSNGRPSALEWVKALEALQSKLRECRENRAHAYHRDLSTCPWCALEVATGWEQFPYIPPRLALPSIDVAAAWSAITGIAFEPVPTVEELLPAVAPQAGNDLMKLAEATRRQGLYASARSVRENAEHAVASLRSALALAEADIEAAQQAVTSFEADNRRLEALRRRLRATERRESKQVICKWIAWLQWHAAALFLAFNQLEFAGILAVLGLIAKLFDWFYRFNFVNIAKLEADVMQLEHSVLGGPDRRSAWLLAARQSREQTAKRLDKALVQLARVQEREARAHAYWQAVEVGLEAARREFEERQQQAAAIRAAIEAKRAELVEQRSQLEAYHLRRVHELATHKQALDAFATRHRGAVKALRDQEREAQLQRHLDQFFITSEKFEGIGVVLMSTLASFGIETAADITEESVMAVPGFGPARTQTLLDWRRSKEAGFRFVAGQIDPAKRAALERRHAIERREAERHLRVGQTDLEARAKTFADAVADYRRAVEAEAMALALAEHEAALVSGRIRGRPW